MAEWESVGVEMRAGGDWVRVDDGEVWNKLTVIQASEGDGPEVRADVEVGADGVAECREVRIRTVGAGRPVRSRDLRAVRLDSLLEKGYGLAVMQHTAPSELARRHGVADDGQWVTTSTRAESAAAVRGLRSRRKRKVDDDLLREVAEVYRANVHRGPTQAVAERFDKATSTAALYVSLARQHGFLGAAIKGKAGEQS